MKLNRRGFFGIAAGTIVPAAALAAKADTSDRDEPRVEVFYTSGTWTKPRDEVKFVMIGGGGSGGSAG